jgi:hypothetical protein
MAQVIFPSSRQTGQILSDSSNYRKICSKNELNIQSYVCVYMYVCMCVCVYMCIYKCITVCDTKVIQGCLIFVGKYVTGSAVYNTVDGRKRFY